MKDLDNILKNSFARWGVWKLWSCKCSPDVPPKIVDPEPVMGQTPKQNCWIDNRWFIVVYITYVIVYTYVIYDIWYDIMISNDIQHFEWYNIAIWWYIQNLYINTISPSARLGDDLSPDIKAECDSWTSKQLASQRLAPDPGLAQLYRGPTRGGAAGLLGWAKLWKNGWIWHDLTSKNGEFSMKHGDFMWFGHKRWGVCYSE